MKHKYVATTRQFNNEFPGDEALLSEERVTRLALDIGAVIRKHDASQRFRGMLLSWHEERAAQFTALDEYEQRRAEHAEKVQTTPRLQDENAGPPEEGWMLVTLRRRHHAGGRLPEPRLVYGWAPPDICSPNRPGDSALLPVPGPDCELTLKEKCAVLAAVHDGASKGTEKIDPWRDDDSLAGAAYYGLVDSIWQLPQSDEGHLRAWLDEVEADLKADTTSGDANPVSEVPEPRTAAFLPSAHPSNGLDERPGRSQMDATSTPTAEYCFRLNGNMWEVRFGDESGNFSNDKKGYGIIAQLLRSPNPPAAISALVLIGSDPSGADCTHTHQSILDPEAKTDYEKRLRQLDVENAKAERDGDPLVLKEIEAEQAQIVRQLGLATGSFGMDRPLGSQSPAANARASVKKALNRVYKDLKSADPPCLKLADHLELNIKTVGQAYAYRPIKNYGWSLA